MTKVLERDQDDERALAAFMTRVAALPHEPALRDPMALWWKSQLLQRWDAQRRAEQPLDLIERVEIVAGLAAAALLLMWAAPNVMRLIAEPLLQLLG